MNPFPLNAWYAAAYDVEVKHALLARTICNQQMVMYRKTDGQVAALEDACWHRLVPLSMGRLQGDEVVCGYHGLVFNGDGRCTHMPSQETINPSACVRTFPVIEKHRFVWVWPGDPAKADPAKVPDLHWNDDPAWAGDGKLIQVKCDYRLVLDNLMDLTHETFVHGSSIGQRAVAEAPFVATHGDDAANIQKLLAELAPLPADRRAAYYVCFAALADPAGDVKAVAEGRCHGVIADAPRGDGGFGYDPLFVVPEFHRSFGELSLRVKQALSHRAKAVVQLRPAVRRIGAEKP